MCRNQQGGPEAGVPGVNEGPSKEKRTAFLAQSVGNGLVPPALLPDSLRTKTGLEKHGLEFGVGGLLEAWLQHSFIRG